MTQIGGLWWDLRSVLTHCAWALLCFLDIASEPMPLYVILIGMTSLFGMGFFLILLQLVRMKFVILLLPVFQLALCGLLSLRLLGILRRRILGACCVSEEGSAREGKT